MTRSRILIVDDESSIRIMLSRMVEPLRHEVRTAADGQVAYEMIVAEPYDLIVSDLKMPRMDGLTLLERIRADGIDSAFIILTGFGDLPQALAAREKFNISNFLVKPIHNLDQFLFDIESAISRRRLELDNRELMASLQRINLELEAKVRQRTQELEDKNRELLRLSNFRADVLKVLGHELRTPLAILAGYYHLALTGSQTQFQSLAGQIGGAIDRLRDIVERALVHLRSSGQHFPLDLRGVHPEELCRQVIERIRPFVVARQIQIRLEGRSVPDECWWDREKIEELIEELLINAVRATPDGNDIEVSIVPQGDEVHIGVRDRGVGIPPEELDRIFEPFVTLGKADLHKSGLFDFGAEGIGIGLSTAKLWADLHQGTIRVEPNAAGPGTTVRLHLPRRVRDQQAADPA